MTTLPIVLPVEHYCCELSCLTSVQSHPWKYTYESHSRHRDGVLSLRKVCVSAALDMQLLCPEP